MAKKEEEAPYSAWKELLASLDAEAEAAQSGFSGLASVASHASMLKRQEQLAKKYVPLLKSAFQQQQKKR